jgi:hypothetical protein
MIPFCKNNDPEYRQALQLAIAKGLSCNGVTGWQYVQIRSGKRIAVQFSYPAVVTEPAPAGEGVV